MAWTNNNWRTLVSSTQADAITGRVKVKFIRWSQIAAPGDDLVLNDAHGDNIITVKAETADLPVELPLDRMYDGLTVTTLDSGQLEVFLD